MSMSMDDFEGVLRNLEFHAPFHLHLPACTLEDRYTTKKSSRPAASQIGLPAPFRQQAASRVARQLLVSPFDRMGLCRCLVEFELMIGRGGFGIVVKARSRRKGQAYAIKIMKKTRVVAQQQKQNIDREVRLLLNMQSPFVAKAFDAFQDIENLYIVMEYLPGGDLRTLIETQQRLSERATRFYAAELILAISYIHSQHITHHDIKPANILITRDGHIKLSDFGVARLNDTSRYSAGTNEYKAPEQFKLNAPVTQSADWYAFGISVYQMLTGALPYIRDTDMWRRVMEQGPKAIQWPKPMFNTLTVNLVSGLLWTDPDKRMGSKSRGGARDVMLHPWFRDVNWQSAAQLEMKPPFIPQLEDEHDTRIFTEAHTVELHAAGELYDRYYRLFPIFRRYGCCGSAPPNATQR